MRPGVTNGQIADPDVLALSALGWLLADPARAQRLLAITGLDPDDLRAALDRPASLAPVLAAVLGFLEGHEPDLIACAGGLGVAPGALVAARRALEPEART